MRLRVALLLAFGVLAYSNAMSGPFILDDVTAIVKNPSIERLSLPGPLRTPADTPVARRPLVNLTFAVNYATGGLAVRGYHAFNLLVHLLAALALFGVVRRTLLLPSLQPAFADAGTDVAWVVALVWLLHPLNTEVVDYVTQRSESMMGLFYFVTLYCVVRGRGRHARRWDLAAVGACAAGVLCKESMVTAPVMVLWYDRTFLSGSWRDLARRRRLYSGLALSWLLLAVVMATAARTTAGFGTAVTPVDYLLNQVQLIPHYLRLAVWPRGLIADYGMTRPVSLPSVIVPGIVLAAAAAGAVLLLVRRPRAGFAAAWFFVTLAPASSFVPIATEVGAERRMYLPLAGLVVLAVTGSFLAARRMRLDSQRVLLAASTLVCVLLGAGTLLRNHEYRDRVTLARADVERRPTGRGHFVLGSLLLERGLRDEGVSQLRQSAASYAGGHYALGLVLVDQEPDEAIGHLRTFIRLMPHDSAVIGARDLIGRVLLQRGDLGGAEREFEAVLAEHPRNTRSMVFLGDIRWRQQRLPEAIALYQRAHAIDAGVGRDRGVMARLGASLVSVNRVPDAERVLAEGIAANPGDPVLQKLRGRTLAMMGRYAEAADCFRRAVAIAPRDEEAQRLVAAAERRLGLTR